MTDTARTGSALPGSALPSAGRPVRALAVLALISSAAIAGLGLVWLFAPSLNPFTTDGMLSIASALLGATPVAAIAVAAGGAGVLLTVAILPRGSIAARPRVTGAGAAAVAVALGFSLGSMATIAYVGYLFGLASVVAGLVTIAVMLVRAPRLGIALLGGLAAILAASVWLAGLTLDGIAQFAVKLSTTLAADLPDLVVIIVSVAAMGGWAALAIMAFRQMPAGRRFEGWLVRHRRTLTILAALGPAPYAIARVSWLTPWPLFAPSVAELPAAALATGLAIGSGAAAAIILTLGLILPWGRVFPTWMPRVGGRPVPVLAAAVPGVAAAGVLCIAAGPMLMATVGDPSAPVDALLVALVLPLWYWGPMLALAVWAYTAWRSRESANAAQVR